MPAVAVAAQVVAAQAVAAQVVAAQAVAAQAATARVVAARGALRGRWALGVLKTKGGFRSPAWINLS